MKPAICFATILLALSAASHAQTQSGKVIYEETMKMDIKLEGENAQFANMFPKEHKTKQVLYFTPEAALFQPVPREMPKEEETPPPAGGTFLVNTNISAPQDKIYTAISEGKTVEQHDFMGRKFLVEGDITKSNWKMTGNQKTILDYPCQEAIMIRDKDTTTAWFTTSIPIPVGPHGWSGLPGLILAAQRNSNLSIVASAINLGAVDEGVIVKPKSGKKVTKEEFKAIVDAKRKEMGDMGGSGGQVIIRIKDN